MRGRGLPKGGNVRRGGQETGFARSLHTMGLKKADVQAYARAHGLPHSEAAQALLAAGIPGETIRNARGSGEGKSSRIDAALRVFREKGQ
ncbi:MAG: hypothetical protein KGL95_12260 [Patescibacteria group bacterium]|nr:hypothetical protein [Patescibacteria group bacterium]